MDYQRLVRAVFICIGYFVLGKLGLYLALPPGYATAVFPSSGLALVGVYLWGPFVSLGVFFGSFVLNLSLAESLLTWSNYAIPALIAFGATLQALIGSFLLKRFFAKMDFGNLGFVYSFVFVGGLTSCLINSSWSISWLYVAKAMTSDQVFLNWYYWYIGDLLGVLACGPIFYIFMSRDFGEGVSDKIKASIPIVISFALFIGIYFYVSMQEVRTAEQAFERDLTYLQDSFRKEVDLLTNQLRSLESLYQSSEEVTWEEFQSFTSSLLLDDEIKKSYIWIPNIADEFRKTFEAKVRKNNSFFTDIFHFTNEEGHVFSYVKNHYFPLTYAVPAKDYENLFGYDFFADKYMIDTLVGAMDSGKILVSPIINHTGVLEPLSGMHIVYPIFGKSKTSDTNNVDSFSRLSSFIILRCSIDELWKKILTQADFEQYSFSFWIGDKKDTKARLEISEGDMVKIKGEYFEKSFPMHFFNQPMQVKIQALPEAYFQKMKVNSWYVLLVGMILSSIIALVSLYVHSTTLALRREKATSSQRNKQLDDFIKNNTQNITLGQLVSGLAHEINNPLSVILAISTRNKRRIANEQLDSDEIYKDLDMIDRSISKIENTVSILKKIGTSDLNGLPDMTRIDDVILNVKSLLNEKYKNHNIDFIVHGPPSELVYCNPTGLAQVFFTVLQESYFLVHDQENAWIEMQFETLDSSLRVMIIDSSNQSKYQELKALVESNESNATNFSKQKFIQFELSKELLKAYHAKFEFTDYRGRGAFVIELLTKDPVT